MAVADSEAAVPVGGDAPRRGKRAIAPVDAGRVFAQRLGATGVGEGADRAAEQAALAGAHRQTGDRDLGIRDGGDRAVLVAACGVVRDGRYDTVGAFFRIVMNAADGEDAGVEGDSAGRGGGAVAPVDGGGVVGERLGAAGVGKGSHGTAERAVLA